MVDVDAYSFTNYLVAFATDLQFYNNDEIVDRVEFYVQNSRNRHHRVSLPECVLFLDTVFFFETARGRRRFLRDFGDAR